MTRLLIVWVGKARKNDPETLLSERYLTRLRVHAKIEQQIIKPVASGPPDHIRAMESDRILAVLNADDCLVLCDERGKSMSSKGLARFIGEKMSQGVKRVVWVIGGSMGVSEILREKARHMLSLSKMTLPHALARVLLTEQIYRAFCIRAGHPYHHED